MRVFVSYKRDHAATAAVFAPLKAALEGAGHLVLYDTDIGPGEGWRARLNQWLLDCEAAVVLLSKAAIASPWVRHEISVLVARRMVDPKRFWLLPVLVDATVEDLGCHALIATDLREIQVAAGAPAVVVAALEGKLPGPTALARAARELALCLNGISTDTADLILGDLGLGPGGVLGLARALHEDPSRLEEVLAELAKAGLPLEQRARVFDLVDAARWIPEPVAAAVTGVLYRTGPRRVVVLDGADTEVTPRAARARTRLFDESNRRVRISGEVHSDDPAAELFARAKAQAILMKGDPMVDETETWRFIEARTARERLAVDVLVDRPDAALCAALGDPFAWFLVREERDEADPCAAWVVDPQPDRDAERDARLRRTNLFPKAP